MYGILIPFEIQDKEYTLDGSLLIIAVDELELNPGNHELDFTYEASLSDGQALPDTLITFDA